LTIVILVKRPEYNSIAKYNNSEFRIKVRKVEGDDIVPAHAAKELHIRTWASDWLA
jgi:hypothetical protein